MNNGSLVNVGLGVTLGSHLSPIGRRFIEDADVVFVLASNSLVEEWVSGMNENVHSLQPYYQSGRSRIEGYKEMIESMMIELRQGKKVCGAFYGHPGVFAWVPHQSIHTARSEGFQAHMEPAISTEDCLYADLGIDPGQFGCQHYDATQLISYKTNIETSAYLVIWQAGIIGNSGFKIESIYSNAIFSLKKLLTSTYSAEHFLIIYESAVLPVERARVEKVYIKDLSSEQLSLKTTLILPPFRKKNKR